MDESVDPCQDFYNFVCGSYIDKAIIPQHRGVHSTLGEIAEENSYRIHKLLTVPKENVSSTENQLRSFYQSKGAFIHDVIQVREGGMHIGNM